MWFNYAGFAVSMSREVDNEQWKLQIKGAVKTSMSLGWRDILNRNSYDQVSTLMCIDTLPGGDSLDNAKWRGKGSWTSRGCSQVRRLPGGTGGLTFFHAVLGGRSSVRSWLPVR